jgi:hypothetical protein
MRPAAAWLHPFAWLPASSFLIDSDESNRTPVDVRRRTASIRSNGCCRTSWPPPLPLPWSADDTEAAMSFGIIAKALAWPHPRAECHVRMSRSAPLSSALKRQRVLPSGFVDHLDLHVLGFSIRGRRSEGVASIRSTSFSWVWVSAIQIHSTRSTPNSLSAIHEYCRLFPCH